LQWLAQLPDREAEYYICRNPLPANGKQELARIGNHLGLVCLGIGHSMAGMRWIIPLLVCAQVVSAQSTNLIVNGSFESPSLPVGVVHYPPAGSLGPWQTIYSQFEIWANPTPESFAKEGSQHLEVEDGDQVVQSIPTVPNQTYRLSFWHSARPGFDNVLTVSVDSSVVQTFSEEGVSASAFNWQFFTTTFVAVGTQTTIGFSNTPITLAGNGAHIDDVRVTAVVDTDGDGLTDDYEMGFGRYQFIEGNFTWEEAKADAERRGGYLGTITSAEEHEFLRTYFTGYANGSLRPWLGASDAAQEGVWRWVTGEIWGYSRWHPNEPNNSGGVQHYLWSGYAEPAGQVWDDAGDEPEGNAININCYLLEFGYPTDPNKADTDGDGVDDKIESDLGSDPNDPNAIPAEYAVTLAAGATTFEVVEGTYTWHQAKVDAVERGGRLAVFPTGDLYDRVIAKVRQSFAGGLWLGLTDEAQEGAWRWIDGTPLAFSKWHPGEPNGSSRENYAYVLEGGRTTWNDHPNGAATSYLLESRVTAVLALPFSQSGQVWTVDTAQTHDGVSSAKAQTTDSQSTYREYTVTGPAVVDFWWKVSSERNFDTFSYSVNGLNRETISGEVDWTYRTLTLPAGDHTIRWTYAKDESGAIGQDAGWLDEFAVYPAEATLTVRDGATLLTGTTTVDFGSTALQGSSPSKSLTFANEGYVPLAVVISLPEGSPFFFEEGSAYELLLGRGESVEVPIFLSTDSAGTKTAQLSISAPDSVTAPPTVTLQGVLLGQKIGVAQESNSLDSGQTINMGLAPRTLQFTISNTGNVGNLDISSIAATGNFQITQQPQTSIAPQSSTSFTVLAQAVAFGNQTGGITITSNDPDTPTFSIPLSATAFAVGGEGIRSDSMATSGTGGAIGWGLASTQLPSGATGQALKTGTTPNNGGSVLEFTSQTSGVVTWSWKVSTQEEFDWLLCEVDGQEAAGISTKNGVWQTQVVQVPAGTTVRWVYRKDGSGSIGEDAGHLADIAFTPLGGDVSFAAWRATHGITDPNATLPRTATKAMFAWLGGVDPATGQDADHYKPIVEGGKLKYRFPISKSARGTQQIQYSSDLSSWTSRGMSQRVLSEDGNRMVVEATAPSGTKGFFKLEAREDNRMAYIEGGTIQTQALSGTVVASFAIAITETTFAEWRAVRDWAVLNGYPDLANVGQGSAPDHPVRDVSWYDVAKWCNAKSEMEGLTPAYFIGEEVYRNGTAEPTSNAAASGYRLPTVAEWEWAARGGDSWQGHPYSGSNDLNSVAWNWDNSTGAVVNLDQGRGTWPVATKMANELGLYDMSGNVWEWCWEWFSEGNRSMRGGASTSFTYQCVVWYGGAFYPAFRGDGIGFRVVRNAED
jgi:formylglycine-generating enzyme required for sulfatase activity